MSNFQSRTAQLFPIDGNPLRSDLGEIITDLGRLKADRAYWESNDKKILILSIANTLSPARYIQINAPQKTWSNEKADAQTSRIIEGRISRHLVIEGKYPFVHELFVTNNHLDEQQQNIQEIHILYNHIKPTVLQTSFYHPTPESDTVIRQGGYALFNRVTEWGNVYCMIGIATPERVLTFGKEISLKIGRHYALKEKQLD